MHTPASPRQPPPKTLTGEQVRSPNRRVRLPAEAACYFLGISNPKVTGAQEEVYVIR
jgi:hypothetical protein